MRARLTSLLLASAWIAGVGCASKKPAEEPSAAVATDQACVASSTSAQANDHDADIDPILTQPTSDPRLAQINTRMYQSLRALDAELRREQRLAACQSASDGGITAGLAVSGTPRATADGGIGASSIAASLPVPSNAAGAGTPAPSAAAAHATSIRRASLSNGGNGATAPKTVPGNDNDIVARRLRKAAEQETNPSLRAKLWKEYTDYRQGTAAK